MDEPTQNPTCWLRLAPGGVVIGLLAVETLLFLAERARWLPKGWPVLIAIAAAGLVMLLMFAWFAVAFVLGRWFQFRLRSLLVLVVAVALPSSWLAVEIKNAKEQKALVDEVKELRGRVTYSNQVDQFDKRVTSDLRSEPDWLRELLGCDFFGDIVGVWLCDAKVTDGWLEQLNGLSHLLAINLSGTGVTDSGLRHLSRWHQLRYLYLDDTNVTDLGLAQVEALPRLRVLGLNGTKITDDGLRHLRAMSDLRELVVPFTQVTDAGLGHLEGLLKLEKLVLSGTKVTDGGVAKLHKALPKCKIER